MIRVFSFCGTGYRIAGHHGPVGIRYVAVDGYRIGAKLVQRWAVLSRTFR